YADKLRAMDVDADPEGFAALRQARDLALSDAESREEAKAPEGAALAEALEAIRAPSALPLADEAPPAAPPASEAAADLAELHMREITAWLHRGYATPWLPPEEKAALLAHWRGLMADPRMDELDFFDRVEGWTAWAILHALPHSSLLIAAAVRKFG